MARILHSLADDDQVANLLAILASGKNPDGTDFTLPVALVAADSSRVLSSVSLPAGTGGVDIPTGARFAIWEFPAITTGTHAIDYLPFTGGAWVAYRYEQLITGSSMPSALPLTGSAMLGFMVASKPGAKVRWTSTGDQTNKPAQVTFWG
jgi:hypothetical protein